MKLTDEEKKELIEDLVEKYRLKNFCGDKFIEYSHIEEFLINKHEDKIRAKALKIQEELDEIVMQCFKEMDE